MKTWTVVTGYWEGGRMSEAPRVQVIAQSEEFLRVLDQEVVGDLLRHQDPETTYGYWNGDWPEDEELYARCAGEYFVAKASEDEPWAASVRAILLSSVMNQLRARGGWRHSVGTDENAGVFITIVPQA